MRKITAGMFMTLDGVVEAPEKWNPPFYDDEMTQAVMPLLAKASAHLYGRRSYELFREVFTGPGSGRIPHAELMTSKPKIVVSTRLEQPDWGPTTLVSGDVAAELATLKEQPGSDITVGASCTLVRFLLQAALLDELLILVHPILVGTGQHLFDHGSSQVPLRLIESRPHRNGVVALHYARAA